MKILGITQIPQQQNTYQVKQQFGYLKDSFTRTSQPAFKAVTTEKTLEEAAKAIMGDVSNKELIRTIGMGLTALGLLIMKTANGDVKLDGEEMQTLQSFKNIVEQNITVPAQENTETKEETVKQPTDKTDEFVPTGGIQKQDDTLYLFKLPVKSNDFHSTLKNMLIQWQSFYEKEKEVTPKWFCGRQSFLKVEPQNILWELRNNNNSNEDRRKTTQYRNIDVEDAQVIADAINSDSRFHEFFTFHGAVRFFDRFINIDEGNVEQQCKEKLDALEQLINKAAGTSGVMLKKHVEYDKNENELVGMRMTIDPNEFGTDFARKLCSYPIILGISENQPNYRYYDADLKEPLIHTIFVDGM